MLHPMTELTILFFRENGTLINQTLFWAKKESLQKLQKIKLF